MLVILVHVDIDISELETSLKLLVYNHFHSTALIILDLQMREMLRSNPTLANCTPFLHCTVRKTFLGFNDYSFLGVT